MPSQSPYWQKGRIHHKAECDLSEKPFLKSYLVRPCPCAELGHHIIQAKAGRFLTRRILHEGCKELTDVSLCWDQQKRMIQQPIIIGIRGDLSSFIGLATEVED